MVRTPDCQPSPRVHPILSDELMSALRTRPGIKVPRPWTRSLLLGNFCNELFSIVGHKPQRIFRPVSIEAPLGIAVPLKVRHVEEERLAGEFEVEVDRGVIRDEHL